MRLDSSFVLALAGTLWVHTMLIGIGDAALALRDPYKPEPAPVIEVYEVDPPPPPPPPEPEPPPPEPEPEPEPETKSEPPPQKVAATTPRRAEPPPPTDTPPPPPDTPPTPGAGGSPVVQMPDIAPSATGVAVRPGPRNDGRTGRGGSGGGTGTGTGTGAEPGVQAPVSIATIKKRAMPKGDYGYIDAGRDYPAAARQLGIEGAIRVRLIVDQSGKVKSAVLLNKLGHGLDELALTRAKQIQFDPALDTNDKPVTSVVIWTFNMTLPK